MQTNDNTPMSDLATALATEFELVGCWLENLNGVHFEGVRKRSFDAVSHHHVLATAAIERADVGAAIHHLCCAMRNLGMTMPEDEASVRRDLAAKAGKARAASTPVAADKEKAKKLWEKYQSGRLTFKSGAAFARHIVENFSVQNTRTVERWMHEWTSEAASNRRSARNASS